MRVSAEVQQGVNVRPAESFSTIVPGGSRFTFTVYGREGTIEHSQPNRLLLTLRRRGSAEREASVELGVPEANTFEVETSQFIDCIRSGAEPLTSAREARKSLAAVLAVYESMRTGEKVYLTEQRFLAGLERCPA